MSDYVKDIVQILFWVTGAAFTIVSIVSVVKAIRQYGTNSQQRVAQSLMDLESRLETHWEIMPLIDPASQRYQVELYGAVENSLNDVPQANREEPERQLILQLDQFLRFLLLLSSLEKYELLDRAALDYMYWYWFEAVYKRNDHLRRYVEKYFPTLYGWLVERFGPIEPARETA
jgi:hypothetical protein